MGHVTAASHVAAGDARVPALAVFAAVPGSVAGRFAGVRLGSIVAFQMNPLVVVAEISGEGCVDASVADVAICYGDEDEVRRRLGGAGEGDRSVGRGCDQ